MNLLLSDLARGDLDDIWLHIADDSPATADRMIDAIIDTFDLLLETPLAGRARPEIAAELRSFPCPPYVIFYRPTKDAVAIARVLHGSRDVDGQEYASADA